MKHCCTHISTVTNPQSRLTCNPLLSRRSALTLLGASSTAAIASLAACSPRDSAASSSSAQNQNPDTPLVLTTFTVIQDMASRVAGEFCQVESITKAGAEIHDYEPTPDDLKRAQKAQLILNNGLGLERWFERFVDDSPAQRADLSEGITAIPIAEDDYQGQANPHAWMSPAHGEGTPAIINNSFLERAGIDPATAIFQDDPNSEEAEPYINVFAVREEDADNEDIKKLAELWHSDAVQEGVDEDSAGTSVEVERSQEDLQKILDKLEADLD